MNKIKFVFLGNSQTLQSIGFYPDKNISSWEKEVNQIFLKYCSSQTKTFNQQSKIVSADGYYHFSLSETSIFYLVLCSDDIIETQVSALIDEIIKGNIYLLIDAKTMKLNSVGKSELKRIITEFDITQSKVEDISNELKQTKEIMKDNIHNMIVNVEDIKDIDSKSVDIKNASMEFNAQSKKLESSAMWANHKCKIIIGIIIITCLLGGGCVYAYFKLSS